jgi:hypothetical protein
MDKPTVRQVAAELGLAIADKPDSQDICFVPEGKYTTVIDRIRPQGALPGDMVHMDGRVLGRHEGVTRYTIGQRRGLNIAVGDPLFVVKIDADKRQVIVGPREALLTQALSLKEATGWARGQPGGRRRQRRAGAGPRALDPRTRPGPPGPGGRQPRLVFDVPGRRRRPRPGLRALRPRRPRARAGRRLHRGHRARGDLARRLPRGASRPALDFTSTSSSKNTDIHAQRAYAPLRTSGAVKSASLLSYLTLLTKIVVLKDAQQINRRLR